MPLPAQHSLAPPDVAGAGVELVVLDGADVVVLVVEELFEELPRPAIARAPAATARSPSSEPLTAGACVWGLMVILPFLALQELSTLFPLGASTYQDAPNAFTPWP